MASFIKQFILFLLPITLFLVGVEYTVTKGLQKTGYKHFKEWNEAYNGSVNADLLIMGSSRAWTTISSKVLESSLGLNTYNLGINGHNFYLQKLKFDTYTIKNQHPKYIIQSLDTKTLERREDLYDYQQFLPFLEDKQVEKATKAYRGLGYEDYFIPSFRYRKDHDLIKVGLQEFLGVRHYENNKFKGFYAYDMEWSEASMKILKNNYPNHIEVHDSSVNAFEQYIKDLKSKRIQLFFVYPPYFYEAQELTTNKDSVLNYYAEIAAKNDIPYWDYSKDSLSFKKELFMDYHHLNRKGAILFTEDLAKKIKSHFASGQ